MSEHSPSQFSDEDEEDASEQGGERDGAGRRWTRDEARVDRQRRDMAGVQRQTDVDRRVGDERSVDRRTGDEDDVELMTRHVAGVERGTEDDRDLDRQTGAERDGERQTRDERDGERQAGDERDEERQTGDETETDQQEKDRVRDRRSTMFDPDYLLRLLADCITYRSSLHDIGIILRCGDVVNCSVRRGLRPIHYAAYVNYAECVSFLLEKGAEVNQPDDIGYTPIHLCSRKGSYDAMKVLIQNGALVDFFTDDSSIDEDMKTLGYLTIEPLNLAIENNHIECVRLLLENGAKPDHKYFMGYEINLVPHEHIECLELLLQYGADPNVHNRCGITPLMKATRLGSLETVRLLIKYGADINLQCPPRFEQKTALHFAIQKGHMSIMSFLLRHGADPARPTDYRYAALHTAVLADSPQLCEILLRWDAQVDELSDEKTTPLMLACATPNLSHQQELVEVLLRHGADPNAHSDILSYTSPCLAPLTEYLRCIADDATVVVPQLLIKYGAKVSFKGSSSVTRLKDPYGILHYLPNKRSSSREAIFQLLVEAGSVFDLEAIRLSTGLTIHERTVLMELGSRPLAVRQLVRLFIRSYLPLDLPSKVQQLPVPDIIRNYLVFEA